MRFRKYASAKVVAILASTLLILGSMMFQHKKIVDLKNQVTTQKTTIEQLTNRTNTFIDVNSIETKLNVQCEFKITDGKVNIKHSYEYSRDGMLGMQHTNKIVGTADLYYQLTTNLRYAKVLYADYDQINVMVELPEVNDKACHRVVGSFRRMDDECSQSILSNRLDAQTALNHWEDTFDLKGIEKIKEYYTYNDVKQNLIKQTEKQIQALFKELGYTQHVNVTVDDGARNTMNIEMGDDQLKTQNGFTLMEKTSEIKTYLNSQKVNRTINKIQIHHMASPSYSTWEKTDKKIFSEPHFGRTNSLNSYGKSTWGNRDDKGHYIAQHFNVFPDGQITSGRSLNSTPIGIKGWNTGAICIEIYGNFDKGKDQMNEAQKQAVIALVAELCDRFDIKPSANTIRYHAWFTAKGTYLGNYKAGSSTKTCPGTGFFGGNTMAAFEQNFLPAIKNYGKVPVKEVINVNSYMVKVTTDTLNVRKGPGTSYDITTQVKKNQVYTIVETQGKWGKLKSGAGWIHLGYTSKV